MQIYMHVHRESFVLLMAYIAISHIYLIVQCHNPLIQKAEFPSARKMGLIHTAESFLDYARFSLKLEYIYVFWTKQFHHIKSLSLNIISKREF